MNAPIPPPDGALPVPAPANAKAAPFNSVAGLGKVLVGLLALSAIVDLFGILSGASQMSVVSQIASGASVSDSAIETSDSMQAIVGILQVLVFFATAIVFLFWMHRAYSNLKSFGATDLKFSPGWAIGYFFVPIMNLFRPFEAMSEIWKASDPAVQVDAGGQWKYAPVGQLLNWWWILWIVANIAGQAVARATLRAEQPNEILLGTRISIGADLISIISAILALMVVREVTRRQEEKHRQTVMTSQASPFAT